MLDDLDIDGRLHTGSREPPAQNVRYVMHGDIHNEAYRIATFQMFPEESARSVPPRQLAASGFFFTGYKDRVKCFSCSRIVEHWVPEDNPRDKKWHSNDCSFANGHDASNIPQLRFVAADFIRDVYGDTTLSQQAATEVKQNSIPLSGDLPLTGPNIYMTSQNVDKRVAYIANTRNAAHKVFLTSLQLFKETDRLRSFFNWTSHRNLVETLATDGFFFLGELDRVQCFSCGTVMRNWNQYDNVHADHAQTSPHCRMVLRVDPANISSAGVTFASQFTTPLPVLTPLERDTLAREFPCNHPKMPQMSELFDRLRSFDRWRRNDIRATVDQIAAAGFFHLGRGDQVKCFYCDGGLQNFEINDEPWHEHAKWYPNCEFLLRNCGRSYVSSITGSTPRQEQSSVSGGQDVPPPMNLSTTPSLESMAVSETQLLENVIAMGFDREQATRLQQRMKELNGSGYEDENSLIDALTRQTHLNPAPVATPPAQSMEVTPSQESSLTPIATGGNELEQLNSIQRERLCKNCLERTADIVVIPCGHLSLCHECAESETVNRCPIQSCKVKIQEKIRAFLS